MKNKTLSTIFVFICVVTMVIFLTGNMSMASQKKVPLRMSTAPVGAMGART
ncbi:MAG: hypothetical protein JRJ85_00080 [Deltaproteobacteria bacterium]|nr:hypothetical protein [Deltaproteobacteria bacterium]